MPFPLHAEQRKTERQAIAHLRQDVRDDHEPLSEDEVKEIGRKVDLAYHRMKQKPEVSDRPDPDRGITNILGTVLGNEHPDRDIGVVYGDKHDNDRYNAQAASFDLNNALRTAKPRLGYFATTPLDMQTWDGYANGVLPSPKDKGRVHEYLLEEIDWANNTNLSQHVNFSYRD